MKKYALLTLTVLFASMFFLPSIVTVAEYGDPASDTFDDGHFTYDIIGDDTVEICGFHDGYSVDDLVIPVVAQNENINYDVVSIKEDAFKDNLFNGITIPKTINEVGDHAFGDHSFFNLVGQHVEMVNPTPGHRYIQSELGGVPVYIQNLIPQISVKFDANGGVVDKDSQHAVYGTAYGELPTPTKDGFNFVGWFTEKDEGVEITSESICTMTEDHTLYAHWIPIPVPPIEQITITFDTDGGSECNPVTIEQGAAIGELPTTAKDGFNFVGWFTDDGVKVDENTTFDKDTTLHAHWESVPADNTIMIILGILLFVLVVFVVTEIYIYYSKH